jgi:hypothetical protein
VTMTISTPTSYAAIWAAADGPATAGCVALVDDGMALSGGGAPSVEERLVRYVDVIGVEVVRDPLLRLNGYPTLRIERRGAPPLRISTIGLGVLRELNELLTAASVTEQPRLIGIVVPLRKRAYADALALVEQGPPFDLAAAGIERHEVLLSDREAIFMFEGPRVDETVQRLVRDTSVWQAASGWARLIAGPPRLAEQRFAWNSGRRVG